MSKGLLKYYQLPADAMKSHTSLNTRVRDALKDTRCMNAVLVWAVLSTVFMLLAFSLSFGGGAACPYKEFHGGNPADVWGGSCYCGKDSYCMCTPSIAIDAIIEVDNKGVPSLLLVNRGALPKGYAIPGGFVNVGESLEEATIREIKEETNLDIVALEQFHMYSDPKRDKRRHVVSQVFKCKVDEKKPVQQQLRRGDDAKAVEIIALTDIADLNIAFDHKSILLDYIQKYHPEVKIPDREGAK